METITGIPEMRVAVQTFALQHGQALPDGVAELLAGTLAAMSPVVTICDTAELLYARRTEIADVAARQAALVVLGQCAGFGAANGWHSLAIDGRGLKMRQAALRELGEAPGEGRPWPDPSEDPAPDVRYGAAEPAAAPLAAN